MKNEIIFRSFRRKKRKSCFKRRMPFLHRRYKHFFKNIKRRRFNFLGKRKCVEIKNRIKKVIKESNSYFKKNEEKIADNSVIDSIVEKMILVQL